MEKAKNIMKLIIRYILFYNLNKTKLPQISLILNIIVCIRFELLFLSLRELTWQFFGKSAYYGQNPYKEKNFSSGKCFLIGVASLSFLCDSLLK
jgi:hypothetical protein